MLDAFEKEQIRKEPPDYFRNLQIVEAMLEEAKLLGVWPPKDPLEGIQAALRIAKVVHVCRTS